jgi:DNA modification methylase
LGSGTTAVACKELNRKYIGIEIDKEYYDIAVNRLNGIDARGQISFDTDTSLI